jgi:hypothetical protein
LSLGRFPASHRTIVNCIVITEITVAGSIIADTATTAAVITVEKLR